MSLITQKAITAISIYVLPVPIFILMAFLWRHLVPNFYFIAFILGLPVLYGYLVPGIATNLLRRWRFRGRFLLGRYYAHHGFLYGSKMTFLLYWAFILLPRGERLGGMQIAAILLMNGLMCAAVFWFGDIQLVKAGMVEIDSKPARAGRSPEEIVTLYAPWCFFLIGASYAAGAVLAYNTFVIGRDASASAHARVWGIGCLLIFSIPSLAYHLVNKPATR